MGIARNDPSKTVDVLSDLASLYTFGFVFFSSFSIVIGWFILYFFLHICCTEGIIGTDGDILNCFITSGVLDFIGTIISRETDIHTLVCFVLLLLLVIVIDYRNLHII